MNSSAHGPREDLKLEFCMGGSRTWAPVGAPGGDLRPESDVDTLGTWK